MQTQLIRWFSEIKRAFPWRETPTPYRVWISEIMLQQTQASVVIPYFEKWMRQFPTVEALANADINEVLKCWEGLGYYSRARNIYETAQYLVRERKGELPSTKEELLGLKGVGSYTAGAILSFAYHDKCPAVDGNVIRVLSRLFGIEGDVCQSGVKKEIEALAEKLLPDEFPWVFVESLIELGALVCKKKPECGRCPVRFSCKAYQEGKTAFIPYKGKKNTITQLVRAVAIVEAEECLLLCRGKKGAVMADLWEFPYKELSDEKVQWPELPLPVAQLPHVSHGFTRFKALLVPSHYRLSEKQDLGFGEWVAKKEIAKLPFSAGHKRILELIEM